MSRARPAVLVVLGSALALVLAGVLLAPRGADVEPDGALTGERATAPAVGRTAGPGRVTSAMRAEIERVVGDGAAFSGGAARAGKTGPAELARALVRCADLEGQRYCLHTGWTEASERAVQERMTAAARGAATRRTGTERTGDLDTLAQLRAAARLTPRARAEAERRELTEAARSVAKVWLLRHHLQGRALPAGFVEQHPEARASAGGADTAERRKTRGDYPRRGVVLPGRKVAEQRRTYWCGPATMQMIAWAWQGEKRPQKHWARRLGTTTGGSAISEMVRVTNRATGFDRERRAGRYIVLDISDWSFDRWLLLQMRHVVDYRAPLILHPILLERFYPYLDDDASGHFQVGRGYDKRGRKPTRLGYFEPWNQQRFDPSEPYIARVQWRSAYKSFRANKAHPHQNIGV